MSDFSDLEIIDGGVGRMADTEDLNDDNSCDDFGLSREIDGLFDESAPKEPVLLCDEDCVLIPESFEGLNLVMEVSHEVVVPPQSDCHSMAGEDDSNGDNGIVLSPQEPDVPLIANRVVESPQEPVVPLVVDNVVAAPQEDPFPVVDDDFYDKYLGSFVDEEMPISLAMEYIEGKLHLSPPVIQTRDQSTGTDDQSVYNYIYAYVPYAVEASAGPSGMCQVCKREREEEEDEDEGAAILPPLKKGRKPLGLTPEEKAARTRDGNRKCKQRSRDKKKAEKALQQKGMVSAGGAVTLLRNGIKQIMDGEIGSEDLREHCDYLLSFSVIDG